MSSKVRISYHSSSSDDDAQSDSSYDSLGESPDEQTDPITQKTDSNKKKMGAEAVVDVMAKILNKKQSEKGSMILCKGTSDRALQKKRKLKEKEERKEMKIKKEFSDSDDSDEDASKLSAQRLQRRLWENMGRVKPDVLDREKERQLQKIATKGVVQLFNAVRKQQKLLDDKLEEAGSSERRKDKVMQTMTKGKFMDVLKGSAANVKTEPVKKKIKTEKSTSDGVTIKQETDDNPSWNILRDDFMMGAKMKDWDKQSEESEGDNTNSDLGDSDSDT